MPKRDSSPADEPRIFDLYDRLDRYEELLEDMAELDVSSVAEIEAKIAGINELIDQLEAGKGE
jgi:uncharacterized small protein (DUF1192 family)